MTKFINQEIFNIHDRNIDYEKVSSFEGDIIKVKNKEFIFVNESSLQKLSEIAFYNVSHYLRSKHLLKLKN